MQVPTRRHTTACIRGWVTGLPVVSRKVVRPAPEDGQLTGIYLLLKPLSLNPVVGVFEIVIHGEEPLTPGGRGVGGDGVVRYSPHEPKVHVVTEEG